MPHSISLAVELRCSGTEILYGCKQHCESEFSCCRQLSVLIFNTGVGCLVVQRVNDFTASMHESSPYVISYGSLFTAGSSVRLPPFWGSRVPHVGESSLATLTILPSSQCRCSQRRSARRAAGGASGEPGEQWKRVLGSWDGARVTRCGLVQPAPCASQLPGG